MDAQRSDNAKEGSMSGTQIAGAGGAETVDMKLEVVVIPVSDVDRAKEFYAGLGWRLDADLAFDNGFRVVQLTPPGSPASVQFGPNMTSAAPGSSQNVYLVVSDIEAARAALIACGVDVTEAFQAASPGSQFRPDPLGHAAARADAHETYRTYARFEDLDGNGWLLQEITTRLPGRVDAAGTSYASVAELAAAMRRAEAAHGEHEQRTGVRDEEWPTWYATFMAAEQAGTELPE